MMKVAANAALSRMNTENQIGLSAKLTAELLALKPFATVFSLPVVIPM